MKVYDFRSEDEATLRLWVQNLNTALQALKSPDVVSRFESVSNEIVKHQFLEIKGCHKKNLKKPTITNFLDGNQQKFSKQEIFPTWIFLVQQVRIALPHVNMNIFVPLHFGVNPILFGEKILLGIFTFFHQIFIKLIFINLANSFAARFLPMKLLFFDLL